MLWLTKRLYVKIAEQNSFLMKASRHSTKKKGLKTNRKDVLLAELQENNREITTIEAMVIDTNKCLFQAKSGLNNPLFF